MRNCAPLNFNFISKYSVTCLSKEASEKSSLLKVKKKSQKSNKELKGNDRRINIGPKIKCL